MVCGLWFVFENKPKLAKDTRSSREKQLTFRFVSGNTEFSRFMVVQRRGGRALIGEAHKKRKSEKEETQNAVIVCVFSSREGRPVRDCE